MAPSTAADKNVDKANIKSVSVFCGADSGADPVFEQEAVELGKILAENNIRLVYGGGTVGLMGAVAQSVFKNGGKITAVVPEPMLTLSDEQLCEPTVVPDMHSRKRRMHDESDAFIVLPGGFGTMEEMLEMITWSQLNIHSKPIILVNTKNYFTPFDSWVKLCVKENFIKSDNANIFVLCESSKQVLDTLNKYKAPEARYVIHWKPSERDTLV